MSSGSNVIKEERVMFDLQVGSETSVEALKCLCVFYVDRGMVSMRGHG